MNYITTTELRTKTKQLIDTLRTGKSISVLHRSKIIGEIRPATSDQPTAPLKVFNSKRFLKNVQLLNLKPIALEDRGTIYRQHLEEKYGKPSQTKWSMANIFLDTNFFIDAIECNPQFDHSMFDKHQTFISCLSVPIFTYIYKVAIPNLQLDRALSEFNLVNLTSTLLAKAANGPTTDLEDNIQLHSAANIDADVFLTADKTLLKMAYFGKTHILNQLSLKDQN